MPKPTLTTESGAPVADNQNSATAGIGGPLLLQDQHLLEKLARFNRERIPERVVHARGSGAHGHFEVTDDVTGFTKAAFLNTVGKRTEVFLRFSTVAGNLGAADAVRDPRGFAVKFYTEEGNYDLVGNNTPVFFIKDPLKFPDFIHSQKRDPFTGITEPDNVWDFWAHAPEATHQITWLFGDRGIPASYRHMDGFGSHTYQWVNEAGEAFWVKYHFKTNQGIRCLSTEQAAELAGQDPDSHQRDLVQAIERGVKPSWTLYVQLMPVAEAAQYRFNPFDLTKVWPHADYPLRRVGRLVLDRNPDNVFAEVEQSAFSPNNFVPGIGPSPDKMLQGRLFAYADAHRYRLGVNHTQLPVNAPKATEANNYGRDGLMALNPQGRGAKNYEPNSYDGPVETGRPLFAPLEVSGHTGTHATPQHTKDDDFFQAGELYRLMSAEERSRLVANIAGSLAQVTRDDVIEANLAHFHAADPEYGKRVEAAVRELRES
ncbi:MULTISPECIES: catalase [Streptomycetaceae]|uniref:Catalase n=1 Tax=Streptantibioticus cattleyicolor (strain ATCC 35852 / DSM 46488 / JCM 4925 / NBRC 14057 / NRRL 8057) TaxID=1003195 RepID=F8JXN3_STREN|nr:MULTISPECIES: catalase [Streptomycetaceae]AEW97135.1 catalase [Streptantibioticus cattleyicolor NRRL 8057 = DSM 46488]MYS61594.1 catalase [Streptomyces sp. SID5468]CCB77459.1 vegetative catalase 1 [Streptantibioticus cattleyicolor NRRL 8057 = DSM 46488]